MREILFRGKKVVGGKMIFGNYHTGALTGKPFISGSEVVPETVRQFTGLLDKNGTKIFDGDFVKFKTFAGLMSGERIVFTKGLVYWCDNNLAWRIRSDYGNFLSYVIKDEMEVIGNIHENPEFLEVPK